MPELTGIERARLYVEQNGPLLPATARRGSPKIPLPSASRPRRGRPREITLGDKKNLMVRVDAILYDSIHVRAIQEHRSISNLVNHILLSAFPELDQQFS